MKDETLEGILEDIKAFHPDVKRICPQGTGEPFMDPDFIGRLRTMRRYLPDVHLSIFTNGSLLNDEHIKQLKEFGNVNVVVSLNGASAKARKALMGLDDFERVLTKCIDLMSNKIDMQTAMVYHPILSSKQVMDFSYMPNSYIVQFQSFGGLMYPFSRPKEYPCARQTDWLTYEWTGAKVKCCYDIEGQADCSQCTEGVQI